MRNNEVQKLGPVLLITYPGHVPNTCGFCGVTLWIFNDSWWGMNCVMKLAMSASVWTRFTSMLQPDQNLRKLVNPKKVGQSATFNWDSGIILADLQCLLVCSDQELIRLQPLLRGYSSGCIGSAEQPSLMEKGSRMTLHYSMTKG